MHPPVVEFGRAVCGDLAAAERREWLVTNGLGSFGSGTIAGTLTRRYHGLLIAAFRPPVERMLLVTKIDEVVRYRDADYSLSANRWKNDDVSPQGFTTIERFYLDGTAPVWEYALADALLEKRIWMEWGANVTYVRYRALRSAAPLELSLRAFVNYRSFHGNTHAGDWHVGVRSEGHGLRVDAVSGGRPFWMVADGGTFEIENVWYRDFVLSQESQRGLDDRDDHLAAGSLHATLAPEGALTIAAADAALDDFSSDDAHRRRVEREAGVVHAYAAGDASVEPWIEQCALAADQFVVAHPVAADQRALSVIAGYHWFGDWGRDTMIALPGLTLATGRPEIAKTILTTFSGFVDGGMLPNFFPDGGETPQYNTVDASLWYVEAAARYADATGDLATVRILWPSLQDVIAHYRAGTRYGIHMDTDGLIVAAAPGVQLTWMDAKIGDWVVTPRMGKPVEIGGLWYNALMRMQRLATQLGDSAASEYEQLARLAQSGFERFWNESAAYCYDVLDGPGGNDATLRPNQLIPAALPHSPLDDAHRRAVVEACGAQLLTSNGMRSLAPSDPHFIGRYEGGPQDRDAAYHQGTAWTWLLGAFAIAHARVYGDVAVARSFLRPLHDALFDAGLGSIGEIADGTAPFMPRGAIAQAWSVAELLRAWREVPAAAQGAFPAQRQ
ncbi:MAG: amylo-alpha-1,6-glucosidase [Candidatus Tumulicola sp.]